MQAEGSPYEDWDRAEVRPFVPPSARSLLDVGCSFGGFGHALKNERPDLEVHGVEPNTAAAAMARERLDGVVTGSFPDDAPNRAFDCLVFNDVLEHLEDPWQALRDAHRFVSPGGTVVASIPNVRHFSVVVPLVRSGMWKYNPTGILDRTHLRFFTKSSMRELFESTGWVVEVIAASRVSPPDGGQIPRFLAALGRRAEEFRAMNYVVVASQRHE